MSCDAGFFWETHLIFLGLLLLTKITEIVLFETDPTLTGEIESHLHLLSEVFPVILRLCECVFRIASALPLPSALSRSYRTDRLLVFYILGVVILQWAVIGELVLLGSNQ